MMLHQKAASLLITLLCATTTQAEPLPFNAGWTHYKFPMMREVTFGISTEQLAFSAVNATSTLYRPLPNGRAVPNNARFTWRLQSAPPATALDARFGSDRPLTVSFVFAPSGAVREIVRLRSPRKIISREDVRTLSYVWGGAPNGPRTLPSPWFPKTAILKVMAPSQTGNGTASLSLAEDLSVHFGTADFRLIAISVSSDTTDTNGTAEGSIGQIMLE